jgi:hypothetical protein
MSPESYNRINRKNRPAASPAVANSTSEEIGLELARILAVDPILFARLPAWIEITATNWGPGVVLESLRRFIPSPDIRDWWGYLNKILPHAKAALVAKENDKDKCAPITARGAAALGEIMRRLG